MITKKELKRRVDIQASILTAIITLISGLSIFILCYYVTYSDTIHTLQERVDAIYSQVEASLDMSTFELINGEKDVETSVYEESRALLETIRTTMNARYVFTVKENEGGRLIYVVDGLDPAVEEFRSPGMYLENELQENAWKAINGEVVHPDTMYNTTWGKFYWVFYPAMKDGSVVGAIGIAFETADQYQTYLMLGLLTPVICIVFCIFATYISFRIFRRISNPSYKDIYNEDLLTGLKSRNAFEVDINNINAGMDFGGRVILSIDLINLKKVNDKYGYGFGDEYIKAAAGILSKYSIEGAVPYRIGADDFVVLVEYSTKELIEEWIKNLHHIMQEYRIGEERGYAFSIGYAIFDPEQDKNLFDTYKRADYEMYRNKRIQKETERISHSVGIDV